MNHTEPWNGIDILADQVTYNDAATTLDSAYVDLMTAYGDLLSFSPGHDHHDAQLAELHRDTREMAAMIKKLRRALQN